MMHGISYPLNKGLRSVWELYVGEPKHLDQGFEQLKHPRGSESPNTVDDMNPALPIMRNIP